MKRFEECEGWVVHQKPDILGWNDRKCNVT